MKWALGAYENGSAKALARLFDFCERLDISGHDPDAYLSLWTFLEGEREKSAEIREYFRKKESGAQEGAEE